jgi:hypothetical protein
MQRIIWKGKIMQEFLTSRQSALDYEAALHGSGELLRKAWKRFGTQLLASIAAVTLSFATIGGAIVAPLQQQPVAASAVNPVDQFVHPYVLLA